MNNTNQTEATAQHYREEGFSVFPLKPKSKEPAHGSWKEYQSKLVSPEQISRWWSGNPELNIAIVCGAISEIVVIDIDDKEKVPPNLFLPPTAAVKTNRGYHYYYRLKKGQKVRSAKYDWGEIRSDGNYVVAPCSTHPSGMTYEWADGGWPLRQSMDFFPDEILEQLGKNAGASDLKLYEAAFSQTIGEGQRNSAMASVIGKLLKDFTNQDEWPTIVWDMVKGINEKRCNPPLPEDELRRTFDSICRAETEGKVPSTEKKEFQITTGAELIKLEPTPNPFLVAGMIYERAINSITADSGKGKSILALIIAKSISIGEKLFGELDVKKTKVLVIDQEMDRDLIVERYKEIVGTEKPEVDYLYEQAWTINEKNDYHWLRKAITERGYGCVIFDTLTNIHTYDENKADDMRELNKLLLKLIRETNVSIVYLHHHRKLQKGEKMNQASSRGSTEIIAKVSSHILLDSKQRKDDQGRTVTAMTIKQSKSRRPESIEHMAIDVIHDPVTKETTWEFRGEVKDGLTATERATDEILALLKENGKMTIEEFKEECSVGLSAIRGACKTLLLNNLIDFEVGREDLKPNAKVYFLRTGDDY